MIQPASQPPQEHLSVCTHAVFHYRAPVHVCFSTHSLFFTPAFLSVAVVVVNVFRLFFFCCRYVLYNEVQLCEFEAVNSMFLFCNVACCDVCVLIFYWRYYELTKMPPPSFCTVVLGCCVLFVRTITKPKLDNVRGMQLCFIGA